MYLGWWALSCACGYDQTSHPVEPAPQVLPKVMLTVFAIRNWLDMVERGSLFSLGQQQKIKQLMVWTEPHNWHPAIINKLKEVKCWRTTCPNVWKKMTENISLRTLHISPLICICFPPSKIWSYWPCWWNIIRAGKWVIGLSTATVFLYSIKTKGGLKGDLFSYFSLWSKIVFHDHVTRRFLRVCVFVFLNLSLAVTPWWVVLSPNIKRQFIQSFSGGPAYIVM